MAESEWEVVHSYREIRQFKQDTAPHKEIIVNAGAPESFGDVRLPECGGGFSYSKSDAIGSIFSNRFITWRACNDVLELEEHSLDYNLVDSIVRYKFDGSAVLNSVTISETNSHIVVLVITISSVHRLTFSHPSRIPRQGQSLPQISEHNVLSIFSESSLSSVNFQNAANYAFLEYSGMGARCIPSASASCLTSTEEALFAVAIPKGSILVVKLPPSGIQGVVTQYELQTSSVMQRLWTGFVPSLMRRGLEDSEATSSLCIHHTLNHILIFSLCNDLKIRLWLSDEQNCVMAKDILEFLSDNSQHVLPGTQPHQLRKYVSVQRKTIYLAIYLCFKDRSTFVIVRPSVVSGQYELNHVATVCGTLDELIDFDLNGTHLWSLWTDSDGNATVRCNRYEGSVPVQEVAVFLTPMEDEEGPTSSGKDPAKRFLERIFQPGSFSTHSLLKAVNLMKKSKGVSPLTDVVDVTHLKEELISVVEDDARTLKVDGYDDGPDEISVARLEAWKKFYSFCVQYNQVANLPIGLTVDDRTGLVCLIKKHCLSYLRPCDFLEGIFLSDTLGKIDPCYGLCFAESDQKHSHEIATLVGCTRRVASACVMHSNAYIQFAAEMEAGKSPADVTAKIVADVTAKSVLAQTKETLHFIARNIENMNHFVEALDCLLLLLDLAKGYPEGLQVDGALCDVSRHHPSRRLFSSKKCLHLLGVSFVQLASVRFCICRDLFILLSLVTKISDQCDLSPETTFLIKSQHVNYLSDILLASYSLYWVGRALSATVDASALESNLRQFRALQISENVNRVQTNKFEDSVTLAELFTDGVGGSLGRGLLIQNGFVPEGHCVSWNGCLLGLVNLISQIMWPISKGFTFPEFLATKCQYASLKDLLTLLDWCEFNVASRTFFLALCHLNLNEPAKAFDLYVSAREGIEDEKFLKTKLLGFDDEVAPESADHLKSLYTLKVIQLYEQFCLPEMVIKLAMSAIQASSGMDDNAPTLWSLVFKYHLELEHYTQAYSAMIDNPDPARKKDCLRQLIIILCERKQLKTLVEFPYVDLQTEVVSLLEARARSADLMTYGYYDLLYSFHVFRGNYRKAATVMYEYGTRLAREVSGIDGLRKQAKCYLASLNALQLIDEKYAWVACPVSETAGPETNVTKNDSRKSRITVLDLNNIEKEYLLVSARLKLAVISSDPAFALDRLISAEETVALLCSEGMFDASIQMCRVFKLSLNPVFEDLALRCIRLSQNSSYFMQGDNEFTAQAWNWLDMNDISCDYFSKETTSTNQAWKLLSVYLDKYEEPRGTRYHQCIAVRLLSLGVSLPHWLVASYKLKNPAQLLQLYVNYDMLKSAGYLLLHYIEAVLGKGKEHFALKNSLHASFPAVWLPYTAIDQLLRALKDVQVDPSYEKLYELLQERLTEYMHTVRKVSGQIIKNESLVT